MTKKAKPPESEDKDAESAVTDSAFPMDNFRKLAGRVVNVSKEELQKEQKRYGARRAKKDR